MACPVDTGRSDLSLCACTRLLQTRSQPPLPPLRLTFFINLAGCISLAACYNLPRALGRLARSHSSSAAAAASEETSPLFPGGQVAVKLQTLKP